MVEIENYSNKDFEPSNELRFIEFENLEVLDKVIRRLQFEMDLEKKYGRYVLENWMVHKFDFVSIADAQRSCLWSALLPTIRYFYKLVAFTMGEHIHTDIAKAANTIKVPGRLEGQMSSFHAAEIATFLGLYEPKKRIEESGSKPIYVGPERVWRFGRACCKLLIQVPREHDWSETPNKKSGDLIARYRHAYRHKTMEQVAALSRVEHASNLKIQNIEPVDLDELLEEKWAVECLLIFREGLQVLRTRNQIVKSDTACNHDEELEWVRKVCAEKLLESKTSYKSVRHLSF